MSGKLDQSLDDILKTSRSTGGTRGRGARARARVAGRKATAPVIGGISKSTKATKATGKASTSSAVPTSSKILVTGLPFDVTEDQIKEYFQKIIAPVRSVVLTYGANGSSRGIATVVFNNPNSAALAASKLDGSHVDGRAMKIEVILSAKHAPAPRGLGERIAQPKAVASNNSKGGKAATAPKGATTAKTARGGAASKRGGRNGRINKVKKTADDLDAEMADYFVPKENNPSATGGDAAMEDQIM